MSLTKKQHYVPQFYLRRFANKKSQVNVYDKFNQKSFRANVKDVASANYFYDLSADIIENLKSSLASFKVKYGLNHNIVQEITQKIEDVQVVEKTLSRWESSFARTLDNVISVLDKRKRFKERFRDNLSIFISTQFWRTFAQRQSIIELEQNLEKQAMELIQKINKTKGTNYTAKDLDIAFDQQEAEDRHKFLVFDTDNILETAAIFANHIWVIGINDTKYPLYTSDNPVARRAHKKNDWRSNIGIASPGVEIMFPLSPQYTLTMYERNYFKHLEKHDGKTTYLKQVNITYQNFYQTLWSYRQLYSSSNEFGITKQMLQENENLANPQPKWS